MVIRTQTVEPLTVTATLRGAIPARARGYARSKLEHIICYAHEPVLSAHVVLTQAADPAVRLSARAEASLDVNGTPIRGQAVATDMFSAIDLLQAKLWENLVQHDGRTRTRHRWIGVASEHEWRHRGRSDTREARTVRPADQREVVRRKTFAIEPMTPDEAAYEMDLLGHDFFLFTDAHSGRDSVVYRDEQGHFLITGCTLAEADAASLVRLSGSAPPLTEAEAKARMEVTSEPFVFYADPDSGRGRVLYLRYDGHYGLITPS